MREDLFIKSLIVLVETPLVVLVLNLVGDLCEGVLGVEGQQLPGQAQGVVQISGLVLALSDELMLKLLEELEMGEIFLGKGLNRERGTSSPMTAFMAAVSLAAA